MTGTWNESNNYNQLYNWNLIQAIIINISYFIRNTGRFYLITGNALLNITYGDGEAYPGKILQKATKYSSQKWDPIHYFWVNFLCGLDFREVLHGYAKHAEDVFVGAQPMPILQHSAFNQKDVIALNRVYLESMITSTLIAEICRYRWHGYVMTNDWKEYN